MPKEAAASSTTEALASKSNTDSQWYHRSIKQTRTGVLAIIGKKYRSPGHITTTGNKAGLKVHIGARLRHDVDRSNAVPGYVLMTPTKGPSYWKRVQRRPLSPSQWKTASSSGVKLANRIEEAEVGSLEAQLLGLPVEVVSEHCCHPNCVSG